MVKLNELKTPDQ